MTFERLRGITRMWNVQEMCNGILAGLVSITASCATVMPWAAIIIGCIGGFVYRLASYWMLRRRIDDPLDAFAVHGACGCWGVVASAFFSTKNYAKAVGGFEEGGVFYGGGELLGAAAVFIAAHIAWVGCCSTIIFLTLRKLELLRAPVGYDLPTASFHMDDDRIDSSIHGKNPFVAPPFVAEGTSGTAPAPTSGAVQPVPAEAMLSAQSETNTAIELEGAPKPSEPPAQPEPPA